MPVMRAIFRRLSVPLPDATTAEPATAAAPCVTSVPSDAILRFKVHVQSSPTRTENGRLFLILFVCDSVM